MLRTWELTEDQYMAWLDTKTENYICELCLICQQALHRQQRYNRNKVKTAQQNIVGSVFVLVDCQRTVEYCNKKLKKISIKRMKDKNNDYSK